MRVLFLAAVFAAAVGCGGGGEVSRELGARCDVTAECDDRCLPPSFAHPDGFCTVDCSDDGDCPGGARCVDLEGGVCLFSCADPVDCEFLGPQWTCGEHDHREAPQNKVSVCRG